MAWVIARTQFGPLDDKKRMFLENEKAEWVELEFATRFDSCKFVLPMGVGAVFVSEEDASKIVAGKSRLILKKKD